MTALLALAMALSAAMDLYWVAGACQCRVDGPEGVPVCQRGNGTETDENGTHPVLVLPTENGQFVIVEPSDPREQSSTPASVLWFDQDADRVLTVADVLLVVPRALSGERCFHRATCGADFDGDRQVTVADLQAIVSAVLTPLATNAPGPQCTP